MSQREEGVVAGTLSPSFKAEIEVGSEQFCPIPPEPSLPFMPSCLNRQNILGKTYLHTYAWSSTYGLRHNFISDLSLLKDIVLWKYFHDLDSFFWQHNCKCGPIKSTNWYNCLAPEIILWLQLYRKMEIKKKERKLENRKCLVNNGKDRFTESAKTWGGYVAIKDKQNYRTTEIRGNLPKSISFIYLYFAFLLAFSLPVRFLWSSFL